MAIIQAVGYFFGHGSGNYILREIGKKNYENASEMAATGFFMALFIGVGFMIGGLVFRTNLAYLLGSTNSMIQDTVKWRKFKPSRNNFKEIGFGGFPSLSRQGLASISMLLLNRFAGGYGDAAIASFAVVTKIINISSAAILGFGQGFQLVYGYNYGTKKYDRVKK